jgi:VanZ family protein
LKERPDILGPVLVGVAVLLVVLTLLNFFVLDRYVASGNAVAVLPDAQLVVTNDDPAAIVRHDLPIALDGVNGFVEVVAVAEGFDIAPGNRPWHRGRIVFLREGAEGDLLWDVPHVVALLKGNPIRWTFAQVFRGDERAGSLLARVEMLKATGTLKVYSLTATPMAEAHGFRAAANGLTAGWLVLALATTFWCWQRVRQRRWLIAVAWLVATPALVLSVLPAKATSPARAVAVEAIDLVSSENASTKEKEAAVSANMFSIAKSGHVIMFFCVGFFIMLARGHAPFLAILLLAVGFAGLCEMLQLFSPNRAPAGFDLMLNTVSAGVGAFFSALLLTLPTIGPKLRKS